MIEVGGKYKQKWL